MMKFLVYLFDVILSFVLISFALVYIVLLLLAVFVFRSKGMTDRAMKIVISIDQTGNALLGGNMDQTISGRMGRRIEEGKASKIEIWICHALSAIDGRTDRHCVYSIERDEV